MTRSCSLMKWTTESPMPCAANCGVLVTPKKSPESSWLQLLHGIANLVVSS